MNGLTKALAAELIGTFALIFLGDGARPGAAASNRVRPRAHHHVAGAHTLRLNAE